MRLHTAIVNCAGLPPSASLPCSFLWPRTLGSHVRGALWHLLFHESLEFACACSIVHKYEQYERRMNWTSMYAPAPPSPVRLDQQANKVNTLSAW